MFTPNELSLILSGVPKIDVKDWQRNTEVHTWYFHSPVNEGKKSLHLVNTFLLLFLFSLYTGD